MKVANHQFTFDTKEDEGKSNVVADSTTKENKK